MKGNELDLADLKALIADTCSIKQDVYTQTRTAFDTLKEALTSIVGELEGFANESDSRVSVSMSEQGDFSCELVLAGDTVVFHMHTNVFNFPPGHMIERSPYVQKDKRNAYCGVINIYNFLSDSFRFQRMNDTGYLVARIFINRENHFFLEGKESLGYRFNDVSIQLFDLKSAQKVLNELLLYVLRFDLYTPPYQSVNEVMVSDILELNNNLKLRTSKRLGFRFEGNSEGSPEF